MISTNKLRMQYGEFSPVKNFTLDISPGEIFALLGPNGAGKTTTIRMLTGILQPTSGTASIKGIDCFSGRHKVMQYVGYVPDDPVFYDYLTGSEIIRYAGEMRGLSLKIVEEQARALSHRLEMDNDLDEYAMNYSKGMKKKLATILALIHDPDILILDEPTNGLDPYATRALRTIIQEKAKAGKSIFYSTHLLDEAEKLCTRTGILYNGKIAALGSIHELMSTCTENSSLEEIFFSVTSETEHLGIKGKS